MIPRRERERLGVQDGGWLELTSTPDGVLLERRRHALVRVADDGLPVITIEEGETVSNADAVGAIYRQRDGA